MLRKVVSMEVNINCQINPERTQVSMYTVRLNEEKQYIITRVTSMK
ncbi:MAG: hypothetical protein QW563_05840 [Candidatus Methanomethylicia archaeon]